MKSLGQRAQGLRLERMKSSRLWSGDGFRNLYPIQPGLRDPAVKMPSLTDFLCGGERRVPKQPLPALNPRELWSKAPGSRAACHVARPFHGADGNRRISGIDRSCLGATRVALAADRPETIPARAGADPLAAPDRPGRRISRSLRSSGLSEHPRTCEAAVPFVTSLGVGAHLEPGA